MLRFLSTRHSSSSFLLFKQSQYYGLENGLLAESMLVNFISRPSVTLQFYIPDKDVPYNMSRAINVFTSIFNVFPSIFHDPVKQHYRLYYTFSSSYANKLVGFFINMSVQTKSRYLRFYYFSSTPNYSFILKEPITFFPLVHPDFDYHDWTFPFEFLVDFGVTASIFPSVREIFHV